MKKLLMVMALAGMTATGFAQEALYRSIASLQILSGAIGSFRVGLGSSEGDADGIDKSNGKRGWDSHDNRSYAEIGFDLQPRARLLGAAPRM